MCKCWGFAEKNAGEPNTEFAEQQQSSGTPAFSIFSNKERELRKEGTLLWKKKSCYGRIHCRAIMLHPFCFSHLPGKKIGLSSIDIWSHIEDEEPGVPFLVWSFLLGDSEVSQKSKSTEEKCQRDGVGA